MAQHPQENKPLKLNTDVSREYLPEDTMFFALNNDVHLSANGKGTIGKATPWAANKPMCEMEHPAGETYSNGSYYSPLTNEEYNFVYNQNGVHFISRTNADGSCQVVYYGLLAFNADPKHKITGFRALMKVEKVCANRHGKQIVFTDGTDAGIYQIDVEASIATENFTTPFFQRCPDPNAYIKKCVPEVDTCIQAEFIPLTQDEFGMSNRIVDIPLQFMVKHVYYDDRESEWSDRSTTYFQSAKACFNSTTGLPRCMKLRVPVGNPMVDRIKIAFTNNGGLSWYETETVEKYKKYNNQQEKWYERGLAELTNYSDDDCSFDYIFCNDRARLPVPAEDVARVMNPIPREVQGVIPIDDTEGWYNYKQGTCPVDKAELDKFKIETTCDSETLCTTEYATVTVRAIIHDGLTGAGWNGFVFRLGGETENAPDDPADTAYFGNTEPGVGDEYHLNVSNGQQFYGKVRNFIAYIDGTDYWGEMKQWKSDAKFVNRREFGVVSKYNNKDTRKNWFGQTTQGTNGIFFYQEYKFRVIKGTKGFIRLVSHKMETGTGDAQDTSTFVVGLLDDIREYEGNSDISVIGVDLETKEIYFDTTAGDFETYKTIVIADNVVGATAVALPSYSGYVKDLNNNPVEGAVLEVNVSAGGFYPVKTDHNGFYHFCVNDASISGPLKIELNCSVFANAQTIELLGFPGVNSEHNITIESSIYADNFYAFVNVPVLDCNNAPVPGIRISISGSKSGLTRDDGVARLRIRNYQTRNRVIRVVLMNNASCITKNCNNVCNPSMPDETKITPACYNGKPIIPIPVMKINTDFLINTKGLKSGGRYPFGLVVEGDCGRLSAVYPVRYIDIPRTQEKGGLGFCRFQYSSPGITLPPWATKLKIVRGENINKYLLQWVVDKIEREDGKIKLTIQSLNDYNTRYFNQTNVTYVWLKGDRVEFIRNGDGKIFSSNEVGVLNYLTISPFHDELISGLETSDADYFNQLLIEDDNKLGALKAGAIIEIQRPIDRPGEIIYYEFCANIPIVDGHLVSDSGTFETFDTYIVSRTSSSFLGHFEHHSPSDFWGNYVTDTGKAHIVNRYENERRFGRNIAFASPTVTNRFSEFLVKTFGAPEQGDITAMWITDAESIAVISEHDTFLARSADELVRVGSNGTITAAPPDAIISNADQKIRGAYGCQYPDIGSVYFGDGYFVFADVNKDAYVMHDYNEARDVSEGKTQTFFRRKFLQLRQHRNATDPLDRYRFATGFNRLNGSVIITIKSFRHSAINNHHEIHRQPNETIVYNPAINEFLTFTSFTPENYGSVKLTQPEGCNFIAYFQGIPYLHPTYSTKGNEFFGVACDWYIGASINKFREKIRIPVSFEIKSEKMWFAKEVKTNHPLANSYIPPKRVTMNQFGKWNAAFLRDVNSRGGLYEGEVLRGYSISVLLCRDNTQALAFNTIDDSKRTQHSEVDTIFFKFSMSEQSGFDQNL